MNFKEIVNDIGSKAKKASIKLRTLNADKKKIAYECLEENINNKAKDILKANEIDIENATNNEIKLAILKTAAQLKKQDLAKTKEENPDVKLPKNF